MVENYLKQSHDMLSDFMNNNLCSLSINKIRYDNICPQRIINNYVHRYCFKCITNLTNNNPNTILISLVHINYITKFWYFPAS